MIANTLKSGALAALVGVGLLSTPAFAEANYPEFVEPDTRVITRYRDRPSEYHPDWWDDRHYDRNGFVIEFGTDGYRTHYKRRPRPFCSVESALDKAEDLGMYRLRVLSAGERSIKIRGRKDGERVVVRFSRAPGCPIISAY